MYNGGNCFQLSPSAFLLESIAKLLHLRQPCINNGFQVRDGLSGGVPNVTRQSTNDAASSRVIYHLVINTEEGKDGNNKVFMFFFIFRVGAPNKLISSLFAGITRRQEEVERGRVRALGSRGRDAPVLRGDVG